MIPKASTLALFPPAQGCSPVGTEISTAKAEAKPKEFNVLKAREQLIPAQDHRRTGTGRHRAGSKDLLQIHRAGVVPDGWRIPNAEPC